MAYSLSILQNDRVGSVIVSLTENVDQNFSFSFDFEMIVQDVLPTGIDLADGVLSAAIDPFSGEFLIQITGVLTDTLNPEIL